MNPIRLIRNFKIRYKLLFIFSFTFIAIMSLSSLTIYFIVKRNVESNIERELQNSTSTILNNVKTSVSVSIKNHLRATAEKNYEIVDHLHGLQMSGDISADTAKERAADIILSQTVGENGYICLMDSTGRLLKHPKKSLEGLDISDHQFVQEMISKKNGYIEYEWQNPDETSLQSKAMFITYFQPWDWLIVVSSYRKEFTRLVNINDFEESILSLRFGKTGYAYVIDARGNVIIHPELTGVNLVSNQHFFTPVFEKMLVQKNGKTTYLWKNSAGDNFREKLVYFNYIPEYDWIVASSSYMDEIFAPLKTIKNFIGIVAVVSLILFIPITFILSATITNPLQNLMNRFNQDIIDGFSDRLVKMESQDELGQLSFYYNSFMDKLEAYNADLKAQMEVRKQAQIALKESEEKYRSVMEATPDPIIVYDIEGYVRYMNPAFTKVFGYTLEETIGKRMDHFVPPEHWKETMKGIEIILAGNPLPHTESRRKAKDHRLIDVTIRGSVYRDQNGNPLGAVITHRDNSEVKRLEKAIMEASEKERQKIGNDLHDDLCPHLIGIEGLTKVLKQIMAGHSGEASQLSDDIIRLIREAIQKTRMLARGLCPVYFNQGLSSSLRELVANTKSMHRIECHLNDEKNIPLGNNLLTINLYHIAQEAVQNAIRHGKASKIKIEVGKHDNHYQLIVQDNGKGIDLSKQTNGMGLRIMKYRASLIGASLMIRSENGGRIEVTLPLTALT